MWRAIVSELTSLGVNRPWLEQAAYMTGYNAARLSAFVGASTGLYAAGHKLYQYLPSSTIRKRLHQFSEDMTRWKRYYKRTGHIFPVSGASPGSRKRPPPPPPQPEPKRKKYSKKSFRFKKWRWIFIYGKWLKQNVNSGRISKDGRQ